MGLVPVRYLGPSTAGENALDSVAVRILPQKRICTYVCRSLFKNGGSLRKNRPSGGEGRISNPRSFSVLPNGSALGRHWPQLFETEQHGERPFQLPVEMHLVASEPLQLVGIKGLTKRLLADQGPV